jgi:hypothetical protein
MTGKTHDVADCRCGESPKMMEGAGGYVIVCVNKACPAKIRIERPRAGQAVKDWNARIGVPKISPRSELVTSSTGRVMVSTSMAPKVRVAAPIVLTWRQAWRWRLRRIGLRALWILSRPKWRSCKPCPGEFTINELGATYICRHCGLPYADPEAEAMLKTRAL